MGEDLIMGPISKIVNAGNLAGAATLVWQDGRVIQAAGVGWRNIELKLPIQRDTLFRIASMTKPITSTLALMLFEEGRFALNDPITRWAPEFLEMRVLRSPTGALDQTDPAERSKAVRQVWQSNHQGALHCQCRRPVLRDKPLRGSQNESPHTSGLNGASAGLQR